MYLRSFALAAASLATTTNADNSAPLSASSKVGQRILSSASVRELQGNNNEYNYYQNYNYYDNNDRDITFVARYDIKYRGCSSVAQFSGSGGNDGDGGHLYTQNLVKFSLCPTGDCDCPNPAAEYVMDMTDFVDAYTEFKMEANEAACEYIRENCYYDDEWQCYAQAGMEQECSEYNEGNEEFDLQEYLECKQLENNNDNNGGNNNNGNGGQQFYVGPYCSPSDNWTIRLGVFYDGSCSSPVTEEVYSSLVKSGQTFTYMNQPLVSNDCVACQAVQEEDEEANQQRNNYWAYYNYNNQQQMNGENNNNNMNGQNNNYYYNNNQQQQQMYGNNNNMNGQNNNYYYNNNQQQQQQQMYGNNNNNNYYYNNNNGMNANNYENMGQYYYNLEVNDFCSGIYEQTAKCEINLEDTYYQDVSGCDYIERVLPTLEKAAQTGPSSKLVSAESFQRAVITAISLGASTLLMAVCAVILYRQKSQRSVNLYGSEGNSGFP